MRFRIRFAYQIVGILSILGLALILLVIFILGSSQRWFVRDYTYTAYFDSAYGLSANMPVLYKGFTIGNVKRYRLTGDDRVEVTFTIFNTYAIRVREGSLVDLQLSPIGLGNRFVFYSGLGANQLEEGYSIPIRNSPEGKRYIAQGLAAISAEEDKINGILDTTAALLANLNTVAGEVEKALAGSQENAIGRILDGAEGTIADLSLAAEELRGSLETLLGDIQPIVANLRTVSDSLADPAGTVGLLLDPQGPFYTNLDESLQSIAGTLANLEKTSAYLPTQLPQLGMMIIELRIALQSAQDVLTSLSNNPLIRSGIPRQTASQATGTNARDVSF